MADTIKLDLEEEQPLTPDELYAKAVRKMEADEYVVKRAFRGENYRAAAAIFEELGEYPGAEEKAQECLKLAGQADEDAAKWLYEQTKARGSNAKTLDDWEKIRQDYESLGDYRDVPALRKNACRIIARLERRRRHRQILTAVILLALVGGGIYAARIGLFKYAMGVAYSKAEMYRDAQAAFKKLGNFLDSEQKALEAEMAGLKAAEKGDEVFFGDYRWLVLSHKEDTLRLIVRTVNETDTPELYGHAFHEGGTDQDVTWQTSSLRAWLNGEFLEEHFTDGERACLMPREMAASINEEYGTGYPGSDAGEAGDPVTILTAQEAQHFHRTLTGVGLNWWLATPGNSMQAAAFRTAEGQINWYGDNAADNQMAVRPVVQVVTQ